MSRQQRTPPLAAALVLGTWLASGAAASGAAAGATQPPTQAARAAAPHPATDPLARNLTAGRFGTVAVYTPAGTPRSVAIFLSGDGGWELGVVAMAHALRDLGAVVIGVDVRRYLASLHAAATRANAPCQMIAADFETLSHQIQKQLGLTEYRVPVLVGYSSGATVVYAVLVQSPPGTFAGALSLGFCAEQDFGGAALCPGNGLRYGHNSHHELVFEPAAALKQPWIALQGQQDQVCNAHAADTFAAAIPGADVVRLPLVGHGFGVERNWLAQFRAAYARLAAPPAATTASAQRPAAIGDLPLEEVRTDSSGEEFALLLTGDGGWAGLDQELAARLAAQGVPTVALNSLKYFWSARSAEATAQDVARVLRHYLAAWNRPRVLLIGYSFGADVLPFVFNRLPQELRAHVLSLALLGVDAHASFEVRVSDWVGGDDGGALTLPEIGALAHVPVLCIYGEGEADSICPQLPAGRFTREQIGRGHHFSGEYATLAERILAFARASRPVT